MNDPSLGGKFITSSNRAAAWRLCASCHYTNWIAISTGLYWCKVTS